MVEGLGIFPKVVHVKIVAKVFTNQKGFKYDCMSREFSFLLVPSAILK